MRYVALLRGVNAGGNRRVPKAEFQAVLEGLGFRDVLVYINSGNAVFTSDGAAVSSDVQAALEGRFGFAIPTLVLRGEKVQEIAAAIPPDWTNDAPKPDKSGQKSDVLYLFDEINTPDILERLGYNPDIETMYYVDGAVIANITRANQMKGSLQKIIGTKLYANMTVRNVNTARKLAELIE
ncbi:MAG TPA: DUF1697 domain-containing protein [Candidatus Saccharibacteria bacterium]|nr:DUF1697 domain-containing protein [Candidatus Saccharibacteria bacterium]